MTHADRETLDLLHQVAQGAYSGLDLRFDGGPHVAKLDRLVSEGLLTCEEGSMGYNVSYALSEQGRAALAAGRDRR